MYLSVNMPSHCLLIHTALLVNQADCWKLTEQMAAIPYSLEWSIDVHNALNQ